MTVQEILELTRAGFTKDEIVAMAGKAQEQKDEPAPAPEPEQKAEPVPEPEPDAKYQQLLSAIADLKTTMQFNNLMNVNQKTNNEKSVDDILANIINPPKGE